MADLQTLVEEWIAGDPDPKTRAELQSLVAQWPHSREELEARFSVPLAFGTAGLRGPVRAGPGGMNCAVVRRTTAGLIAYLREDNAIGPVVIGYDGRSDSARFAHEAARIVAASGREAIVSSRALPTPVVVYLTRALRAAAGIVITASHNPPTDNGYKIYLAPGLPLAPPEDVRLARHIAATRSPAKLPTSDYFSTLDESHINAYVAAMSELVPAPVIPLRVAYTPLHGVGGEITTRVFRAAGFDELLVVPEQALPDPRFPTTPFPNPEESGTMDLLLSYAKEWQADIAFAHDPDADRCAVAVPDRDNPVEWRKLTGDEVGILLADMAMGKESSRKGAYVTTIVSSSMLSKMCAANGVHYEETLTGFKWVMKAASNMQFGYEEAMGYSVAPRLVGDKDGISAALSAASLAAELAQSGHTLVDRLSELSHRYGQHLTRQISLRGLTADRQHQLMQRLRAFPPEKLAGQQVAEVSDFLPTSDVLRWKTAAMRVVVRPSGTEPVLKTYLEVVGDASLMDDLLEDVKALLADN